MAGIFISYRRKDSAGHAGRLYDHLVKQFGRDRVFLDMETIPAGANFEHEIEHGIGAASIVLVVLGSKWYEVTAERTKLHEADPRNIDYVAEEIEYALRRDDIRVIPALVQGATMPSRDGLPEAVLPMLKRNAVQIPDDFFNQKIDGLVESIRSSVGGVPPPGDRTVIGQVVVDHGKAQVHVNIGPEKGVVIKAIPPEDAVVAGPRRRPVHVVPSTREKLIATPEVEAIRLKARAGAAAQIYGERGSGKTAVMLAAANGIAGFPDGVVFVSGAAKTTADVNQECFEAFYEGGPMYMPAPSRLEALMRPVQAALFVDDVEGGRKAVKQLSGHKPGCAVVVSSRGRLLRGDGCIAVGPLADAQAIALLAGEFDATLLPTGWEDDARAVCRAARNHPRTIYALAAVAHSRGLDLRGLRAALDQAGSAEELRNESLGSVPPEDRNILETLARVGAPVTGELATAIAECDDAVPRLGDLVHRGIAVHQEDGYELDAPAAEVKMADGTERARVSAMLGSLKQWARAKAEEPGYILEARCAVFALIGLGVKHELWMETFHAVRAVEAAFGAGKRWGSWEALLRIALAAARKMRDRNAEAWALHQLGSLVGAAGRTREGKKLLGAAIEIRRSLCDADEDLRLSCHNLGQLHVLEPMIGTESHGVEPRRALRIAAIAAGVVTSVGLLSWGVLRYGNSSPNPNAREKTRVAERREKTTNNTERRDRTDTVVVPPVVPVASRAKLQITPEPVRFESGPQEKQITMTNRSDAAMTLSLRLVGNTRSGFSYRAPSQCDGPLGAGESCSLSLAFRPQWQGDHAALLRVENTRTGEEWGVYAWGHSNAGDKLPEGGVTPRPDRVNFKIAQTKPPEQEESRDGSVRVIRWTTVLETQERAIQIENRSDAAVSVTARLNSAGAPSISLGGSPATCTVPPGVRRCFTVVYTPQGGDAPGQAELALRWTSADRAAGAGSAVIPIQLR